MTVTETYLFENEEFQPNRLKICTVEKSGSSDIPLHHEDFYYENTAPKITCSVVNHIAKKGLPKPGEQLQMVTFRNFCSVEFLDYLVKQYKVCEVFAVIYSISRKSGYKLKNYVINGKINNMVLLISTLRNTTAQIKEETATRILANTPNIEVFYASSHAKIFAISTECGNYFTIQGSGNMANNSRIEQYCIDNSQKLFDFHKSWMRLVQEKGLPNSRKKA